MHNPTQCFRCRTAFIAGDLIVDAQHVLATYGILPPDTAHVFVHLSCPPPPAPDAYPGEFSEDD